MSPTLNAVYWGKDLLIIFNIYFIIIFTFLIYLTPLLLFFKFIRHELLAQILKGTDH